MNELFHLSEKNTSQKAVSKSRFYHLKENNFHSASFNVSR